MINISARFDTTHRADFSIKEDFTFKAVYGRDTEESKRALIDLLNVILAGHGQAPVKSLRLLDPYIPGQTKYSKGSILDILTETDCHVLINVEMQADDFRTYNDRDLLYAGKVLSTYALQSGSDYDKMKKTVMITIMDTNRYCNGELTCPFSLMNDETHEEMSDKLKFIYVQLQAVDPSKPVHELTPLETFASYIRYAGDESMADYVQQLLEHGREYLESSEIAFDEVTRSDTMLSEKEKYYIKMSDIATITREKIEDARAEGEVRGKAEGEKIGKAERNRAIALNMLARNMDISLISELTGLSEDEVSELEKTTGRS